MLARVVHETVAYLAKRHGAHACLTKQLTSGDELEQVILKAIATVGPTRKEGL
jgi:hypothetical protein